MEVYRRIVEPGSGAYVGNCLQGESFRPFAELTRNWKMHQNPIHLTAAELKET
jgi:hypothetical protein